MLYRIFLFLSMYFVYSSADILKNVNLRIYPITKNELYRIYGQATTKFNVSSIYKRDLLYMWENVVRSAINGLRYFETVISYPLLSEDRQFLQEFYAYFPDCRFVIGSTHKDEKNPHLVSIRLEW